MPDLIVRDEQQLAKIAEMERQALAIIQNGSFEQVLAVKDQAQAFSKVLERHGTVTDGGCRLLAIAARCTRELGQQLRAMPKAKNHKSSCDTLSQLGIDRHNASRWQRIASIPDDKFEAYVSKKLAACEPCTQAELLRMARKQNRKEDALPESSGSSGTSWTFMSGDCRNLELEDDSVNLVFCSPPYESQREYDEVGFCLSGDEYVQWAADCFMECLRVCNGLVAWVVEGVTKNYDYSATPFLLMAELKHRGAKLRKPVVYHRNGIPGTGGPDWLRNDWEPIICATKAGKLPWSNNTAMGKPPKPGKPRAATNRQKDGKRKDALYQDPDIANPGNIIHGNVGGGQLGWKDAHENEAPFPQWLAEFFVKSFCPPGGIVLDPFSGSGTTVAAAVKCGRNGLGIDIRESQVWLGETRLMGLTVKERRQGQCVLV